MHAGARPLVNVSNQHFFLQCLVLCYGKSRRVQIGEHLPTREFLATDTGFFFAQGKYYLDGWHQAITNSVQHLPR